MRKYKYVIVSCYGCGQSFKKESRQYNNRIKYGQTKFYCKIGCGSNIKTTCGKCNTDILVRNSEKIKSKSGLNFCSKSCACSYNNKSLRTKENHPNWVDGANDYRQYLKDKCESCSENRYYLLVGHHRDKNRKNCSPDNIQTLCFNCHAMQHLKLVDGRLVVSFKHLTSSKIDLMGSID